MNKNTNETKNEKNQDTLLYIICGAIAIFMVYTMFDISYSSNKMLAIAEEMGIEKEEVFAMDQSYNIMIPENWERHDPLSNKSEETIRETFRNYLDVKEYKLSNNISDEDYLNIPAGLYTFEELTEIYNRHNDMYEAFQAEKRFQENTNRETVIEINPGYLTLEEYKEIHAYFSK